jgi:hypothetical protein
MHMLGAGIWAKLDTKDDEGVVLTIHMARLNKINEAINVYSERNN